MSNIPQRVSQLSEETKQALSGYAMSYSTVRSSSVDGNKLVVTFDDNTQKKYNKIVDLFIDLGHGSATCNHVLEKLIDNN